MEGFCCPVPPEPRLNVLSAQDFEFRCLSCVTQPEQPEHSCRSQLLFWPCNGGTMPGESPSFTPSSILVRPHQKPTLICAAHLG